MRGAGKDSIKGKLKCIPKIPPSYFTHSVLNTLSTQSSSILSSPTVTSMNGLRFGLYLATKCTSAVEASKIVE